jgi:hypothetical protein
MATWSSRARDAGRRVAREAFEEDSDPPPYPSVRAITEWMREIVPGKMFGPVEGEIKSAFIDGYRAVYEQKKHGRKRKSDQGSVVTFADVKLAKKLGSY